MEELTDIRSEIDTIDNQIVELFEKRMACADKVAEYKRSRNLPVFDRTRERQKLADIEQKVPEDMQASASLLFRLLMEVSSTRQYETLNPGNELVERIEAALSETADLFPQSAYVACQGVEGAFSQIATDKLFKRPNISYFDTFEGVFRAVEDGFCTYGIVPVENSTAGTVNEVYDLMMEHDFNIIRSTRVKVDHNLLVKPGVKLEQIKEVYSHEQALGQCADHLANLGVTVHIVENTAVASKMVSESERTDIAAVASRTCADLYGLEIAKRSIQDNDNNYTRFICISKALEIYPGANRSSLMMIVNHEPGALSKVLSRFYALDINLNKLESRPIPGRDFEFMFYFDIDCPVSAPEFKTLLVSLDDVCEEYRYLGSYTEVI